MRKLFEFCQHIGRWKVLVQTNDISNKAVTREKLSDDLNTLLSILAMAQGDGIDFDNLGIYTKDEIDELLQEIRKYGLTPVIVDSLPEPSAETMGKLYLVLDDPNGGTMRFKKYFTIMEDTSTGDGGNTETPTGDGGNTETPTDDGGNTETPTGDGGNTETPTDDGGNTETPTDDGGNTETPTDNQPLTNP